MPAAAADATRQARPVFSSRERAGLAQGSSDGPTGHLAQETHAMKITNSITDFFRARSGHRHAVGPHPQCGSRDRDASTCNWRATRRASLRRSPPRYTDDRLAPMDSVVRARQPDAGACVCRDAGGWLPAATGAAAECDARAAQSIAAAGSYRQDLVAGAAHPVPADRAGGRALSQARRRAGGAAHA